MSSVKWNEPETAPRNGDQFIGKIKGYPFPCTCAWNSYEKKFIYPWLQINFEMKSGTDNYFDTEMVDESYLLGWIKLDAKN